MPFSFSLKVGFKCGHPRYATPILAAGGIGIKMAQRTAFVKVISNYTKMEKTKK